jgi:hypothetical protein
MRLAAIALVIATTPACTLWFGGDDGDDAPCLDNTGLEAPEYIVPLRNPDTLTCDEYGGGCTSCPCPGPVADPIAIPSWGQCYGPCESLTETQCAAATECRVVKDAECSIWQDCTTDFIGCFALDMAPDSSVDCYSADSYSCSRNNDCTALHSVDGCPNEGCVRPFELCIPEGTTPGACYGEVLCDAPAPACPTGRTPGIDGGCYTGACIPDDLCGPAPL